MTASNRKIIYLWLKKSVGDLGDEAEGSKGPIEVLLGLLNIFLNPTSHLPHPPHISHEHSIEHTDIYTFILFTLMGGCTISPYMTLTRIAGETVT